MDEVTALKEDIRASLRDHRLEVRSDIKDLHMKIDKRFDHLHGQVSDMRTEVTINKTKVSMFGGVIAAGVSAITAWLITNVRNGGG